MLNPSSADAEKDDPTVRRCIDFAQQWGFSTLTVVNLFAFRSANPDALRSVSDPIGPENDAAICCAAVSAYGILCAWGAWGCSAAPTRTLVGMRAAVVLRLLREVSGGKILRCLSVTKGGRPKHPLYVRRDAEPMAFPPTPVASARPQWSKRIELEGSLATEHASRASRDRLDEPLQSTAAA